MSTYGVNKFLRTCQMNRDFRALAKSDPETAMAQMPLTDAEKEMMRRGDIKALYEQGVHAFILSYFTRFELFGVTVARYSESIQQAKDWRKAAS